MCNSTIATRTAADYAEAAAREEIYARQQAINTAHDREADPDTVVARARAYADFIING